jgi:molybdate transport system regulatory protein
MPASANLTASLMLRKGTLGRVGGERIALLEAVRDKGSITSAARTVGLSYKAAWDALQAINNLFKEPLVIAQAGGTGGGAAHVTRRGLAVIQAFHAIEIELEHAIAALERRLGGPDPPAFNSLFWSFVMKTSARNALRGVVTSVKDGAVNAEVVLEIAPGEEIVATITRQSVTHLDLAPGREAIALIKASSIILAPGDEALRTSARNRLKGVVARREDGAVNSEITLVLESGKTLTATITRESAWDLDLHVGAPAAALVKSSHVILAVE